MRIGSMLGSDKERSAADRLAGLVADAQTAERAGFTSMWIPQIPGYLDAMTAIALAGSVTTTIEIGTAVVPLQTRHPVSMAQQALTTQSACGGRFTLGLGPSHHWIVKDQLGLPYDRPAGLLRDYLAVLNGAFAGTGKVDVDNANYRVHSPMDVAGPLSVPVVISALGPVMLRIAGEHAAGTILWMADERAISDHIAPRITKIAAEAGRPTPRVIAGVPVALCGTNEVDAARAHASEVLGHADISPNYERLLEHGDAEDVGDTMAAGDETAVVQRLLRYRDAGVTDLAARIVPLGDDPASRLASWQRTQDFLATLCPEL